ncbi:MAG: T9SS type A sorting domain-containing protein, partial [Flavobacteriales bacterium]
LSTAGDGCDGVYDATVEFMNLGTTALTSATVTATGCSNCPISQPWSGDLASYELGNATVTGIEVTGTQLVEFEVTASGDANVSNNFGNSILLSNDHTTRFTVAMTTDNWPYETTWDLKDGSGSVVMTGGPYGLNQTAAQDVVEVFEDFSVDGDLGCWEFTIYDEFGDGMRGTQWGGTDGFATVQTIDTDGNAYTFHTHDGSYDFDTDSGRGTVSAVSVEEADALQASMNVYPNPINADSKLAFTLTSANTVSYQVVDLLGKVVISENLGTLPAGTRSEELNIDNLESGIYMIQLTAGASTASMKLTLAK